MWIVTHKVKPLLKLSSLYRQERHEISQTISDILLAKNISIWLPDAVGVTWNQVACSPQKGGQSGFEETGTR